MNPTAIITRPRPAVRCAVLAAGLTALPAAAMQNGSSFDDAAASRAGYGAAVPRTPARPCAELTARSDAVNSVVVAAAVAAADGSPAYCRVRGVIVPEVQYLLYLPEAWNGRLFMAGNWGDAGESLDDPVGHALRLKAVRRGFAVAFTNTGHDAATETGAVWAHDDLQKEIDYGFRAVHLTALTAKALIEAYYGEAARYAYFDGCSTGGRQGLMSAQRFPGDFDGILSGAPVMHLTHMLWQYWKNQMAILETPLHEDRVARLAAIVFARYDAQDGVADGVIGDPLAVDFDPARDLPRGEDGFTDAEIDTLQRIYAPVVVDGREIFPRIVIGGEARGLTYTPGTWQTRAPLSAWHTRVLPDGRGVIDHRLIVDSWFKYLLFDVDDPERDWRTLDPGRDLPRMRRAARLLDAVDPDLSAFAARGGKLILYHGWADFGVNPLRSLQYYREVDAVMAGRAADFFRLYLIPGMQHCWGGTNVDRFDLMTPLIDWVERGIAPEGLVGKRVENGRVTRTRPLCAYPRIATYAGRGDGDRAEHFTCRRP